MKVLHVIDILTRGGSETLLLDVCKSSAKHDIEAIVIASGGGILEEQFMNSGIEFIRFNRRFPVDVSLIKKIRSTIREKQVDVIHSHQPVSALHAIIACMFLKIPIVHSIHGFTEDIKNKLVFKCILAFTTANILVSNAMKSMVLEKEWVSDVPNSTVIYNGINPEKITYEPSSLRTELNITQDSILMGMVGNFYCVKDQMTICKAMKLLLLVNPNTHFLFIGRPIDSVQFNACITFVHENSLQKNVHFLGERNDIGNVLSGLDVFVFSTLSDTFGIALAEAMMAGKPCVVSDIPVMKELSNNAKYAKLFPVSNEKALSSVLHSLVNDKASRIELGKKAQVWAMEKFTIDKHLESTIKLYKSL